MEDITKSKWYQKSMARMHESDPEQALEFEEMMDALDPKDRAMIIGAGMLFGLAIKLLK